MGLVDDSGSVSERALSAAGAAGVAVISVVNPLDVAKIMKDGKIAQMGKYEDLINDLENELARQMVAHRKTFNEVNSYQELDCTVQASLVTHFQTKLKRRKPKLIE
ncbi:hypothetical protein Droror1_Dr00022938 [Drosera rotundifolia]